MPNSKLFLYCATVVVGVVVFLWLQSAETVTATPAIVERAASVQAPSRANHDLQQQLGELTEEMDALWEAQEAQADLALSAANGDEMETRGAELSPDEQTEVLRQTLATTLRKEAVDVEWAPEAQASLESGLQKLGGALASVDHVECRATLCVVEFEYDAGAVDPAALGESLGQLAPWPNNAVSSIQTTEDHRGWLYLSREGHALPGA
jgi:hypothetical protein